jgi:uncharacterized damage-inducible protein DinB
MSQAEVWLRGPIDGVPALLQPVAHSLLQCREELETLLGTMTAEEIWRTQGARASVGFHVRHAIGSLDRLFTYARGATLSDAQLQVLKQESEPDLDLTADDLLAAFDAAVERSLDQLRETNEETLTHARLVGRARMPSTVGGLLFHAAEHTQRHVGLAVTTRKWTAG